MKVLVAILAVGVCLVDGYSNNPFDNPSDLAFACNNLYPKHEPFDPQTGGPYTLSVTDVAGGKKVTISGASFKGFILQASSGQFDSPSQPSIDIDCGSRPTVRHANAGLKDSFSVTWIGSGPVSFKGSAVTEWTEFYTLSA